MIKVLFLAQLREQLGVAEVQVPASHIRDVAELKEYLLGKNPQWEQFFAGKLLVAINHEYAKSDASVKSGDEVAFFPPVTGG
ncbi:MAG: molybdopterin converting factor subunit 1 [Cellvibrio sp.]|uniref:molybdopterin converting factor subunit 1 n=1 Tax=Cellvibrio sp. TaxID=1965322 RepID=UPI0031B1EB04